MITKGGDSPPSNNNKKNPRADYKASWARVKEAAWGNWPEIHNALISTFDLNCVTTKKKKKGFPCPHCGGDDRFHYTDEGRGCWYCRHCANGLKGYADGFNLVAVCYGISDTEAKDLVGHYLGLNGPKTESASKKRNSLTNNQKEQQRVEQHAPTASEIKTTALAILANCDKGLPEYLKNKGFTTTDYEINRSRFNLPNSKQFVPEGAWVIPIQNIDDLSDTISIQYIPKDGKIKFQLAGFKKENGVIFIPGDDSMPYIAIGTGAATCYSFFTAMGCTTIATFDDAEMVKKCVKIANLFPEKKVLIIGDNDSGKGHTKGQDAAHIAANLTNAFAIIPLEAGDWDDYRQTHDKDDDKATNTRLEIERQITVLTPIKIDIKDDGDFNTGLDINYPIKLKNGKKISVHNAMTNHTFNPCYCPLSTNGSAMINAGFIWSFEKKLIKPVLTAWHNNEIIDECKAFPSTEGRIKWVASRYLQTNNMEYVCTL